MILLQKQKLKKIKMQLIRIVYNHDTGRKFGNLIAVLELELKFASY